MIENIIDKAANGYYDMIPDTKARRQRQLAIAKDTRLARRIRSLFQADYQSGRSIRSPAETRTWQRQPEDCTTRTSEPNTTRTLRQRKLTDMWHAVAAESTTTTARADDDKRARTPRQLTIADMWRTTACTRDATAHSDGNSDCDVRPPSGDSKEHTGGDDGENDSRCSRATRHVNDSEYIIIEDSSDDLTSDDSYGRTEGAGPHNHSRGRTDTGTDDDDNNGDADDDEGGEDDLTSGDSYDHATYDGPHSPLSSDTTTDTDGDDDGTDIYGPACITRAPIGSADHPYDLTTDQVQHPPWVIRPSPHRGMGLFAVGGWSYDANNSLLFEYVGRRVPRATFEAADNGGRYAVRHPHGHVIDAIDQADANEPARYINHATGKDANCEFRWHDDGRVMVHLRADIHDQDELLADYGPDYDYTDFPRFPSDRLSNGRRGDSGDGEYANEDAVESRDGTQPAPRRPTSGNEC